MNNASFEVTYTALQAPDTAQDCAVVVSRARAAMVSCRLVRQAQAAVFLERKGEGAVFTVRSANRETIEGLPASYGSMIGHFGVFERSAVRVVPVKEQFRVVYTIAMPFTSYSHRTRRRLAREVGGRLADYASVRAMAVRVNALETTASIVVSGDSVGVLEAMPLRFNAVFQRSAVLEIQ
jgi:uncharacterized protein (DUF2384 family)